MAEEENLSNAPTPEEQEALEVLNLEEEADSIVETIRLKAQNKFKESQTQVVLNKTERPNSFQFRLEGPGSEVKLYFENADDLARQVEEIAKHPHLAVYLADARKKYTAEKG